MGFERFNDRTTTPRRERQGVEVSLVIGKQPTLKVRLGYDVQAELGWKVGDVVDVITGNGPDRGTLILQRGQNQSRGSGRRMLNAEGADGMLRLQLSAKRLKLVITQAPLVAPAHHEVQRAREEFEPADGKALVVVLPPKLTGQVAAMKRA